MTGWTEYAGRLVAALTAGGHISDQRWRDAFANVPRHVFVPSFIRDDGTVVDGANPNHQGEWLDAVYSDTSLVTQTRPVPGTDLEWPTSSSTRPSLMASMLRLLDVSDGQQVLEIGTGTGYHAALLSYRLGDHRISSIDIHPGLVSDARLRLTTLGYHPHLATGDGARGVPPRAPFDRVIATCAIPAVPGAWIDQLASGGLIVADIRGGLSSSLTVLHKIGDRTVQGRFLTTPGHFMWLRAAADNPLPPGGRLAAVMDRDDTTQLATELDPALLRTPDLRFLLQHLEPAVDQIWFSQRHGADVIHLHAADDSWAEIQATRGDRHTVTQGGPRPLWQLTEQTIHLWHELGRPSLGRFGVTASSDGSQRLWLDRPDSEHHWP